VRVQIGRHGVEHALGIAGVLADERVLEIAVEHPHQCAAISGASTGASSPRSILRLDRLCRERYEALDQALVRLLDDLVVTAPSATARTSRPWRT